LIQCFAADVEFATPATPAAAVPTIISVEGSGTALANRVARIFGGGGRVDVIPEEILVRIAAWRYSDQTGLRYVGESVRAVVK
jgi:hypothetical protein